MCGSKSPSAWSLLLESHSRMSHCLTAGGGGPGSSPQLPTLPRSPRVWGPQVSPPTRWWGMRLLCAERCHIKCSNPPPTCAQNPSASHCPPPPPYTPVVGYDMLAGQGWKAGCVAVITLERSPSPPSSAPLEKGGVFLH